MEKKRFTLRKSEILRSREEIRSILANGTKLAGKKLSCHYAFAAVNDNGRRRMRVGFLTRSESLNAVKRNRVKRLMREAYRHAKMQLVKEELRRGSLDLIFSLNKGIHTPPSYDDVRSDIESIVQKILLQCERG